MADRTENYTLFCPCKGIVIEGDLVKVHGERRESLPGPGTFVVCPCGCLHRVHEVDERARLVVVVALSHDEQLDVYADMGLDMVKVGCPHCDAVHATEVPESRARAFGGWASGAGAATGSTPFGADPFHPFGGSS
jgi:hypothetical protein